MTSSGDSGRITRFDAISHLRAAADEGDRDAQFHFARHLANGDGNALDTALAAHYYKLSAAQGHAEAQFYYGQCLEDGDGVPVDKAFALHYYKLSADQGNASANINYIWCLANGYGVALDQSFALHCVKESAYAQLNHGWFLENGDCVELDRSLGAHYYKQSADQGNAFAQFNYGWFLDNGYGVEADKSLAAHYYKLAADQGNALAQYHYGQCLENEEGVVMDRSLGAHYYRLSADQGNEYGLFHYARVLEDKALAELYFAEWVGLEDASSVAPEAQALRAAHQVREAAMGADFTFLINGVAIETGTAEAAALSGAVALQLSVDACARSFAVSDGRIGGVALPSFVRLLSGSSPEPPPAIWRQFGLLLGRLSNPGLEWRFLAVPDAISLLSVDAFDALLSDGMIAIDSEDALLDALLALGPDYFPLLRHVRWNLLSPPRLSSALEAHAGISPPESIWNGIRGGVVRFFASSHPFDSVIISDFPGIFAQFFGKQLALLWRGSRDGFRALDFHNRCDGRANTLTLILDTDGNIFGGFTPLKFVSDALTGATQEFMVDPSRESFLFTLRNPHNFPPKTFRLKSERGECAVGRDASWGPQFCDIGVSNSCDANARSFTTSFGRSYANDTGLKGKTFFTGSAHFIVKEIEVFHVRTAIEESTGFLPQWDDGQTFWLAPSDDSYRSEDSL